METSFGTKMKNQIIKRKWRFIWKRNARDMVEQTSKDEEIKVDEKFLLIITNSILANKVYETEALTGLANDQVVVFQGRNRRLLRYINLLKERVW